MNWNEREAIRERLMEKLSCFMIQHGEIKKDRVQSNPYTCVEMVELTWRGQDFLITIVDGMTCRIDKQ